LRCGDTLTWAIDYYACTGMSSFYFPETFLQKNADRLLSGDVMYLKVWTTPKGIIYREVKR
jgi:hypothetical protein